MKQFKIKVADKQFIVKAENEQKAVRKLQDAQRRKLKDSTVPEVDDWVIKEAEDIVKAGFDDEQDLRNQIHDLSDDLTPKNVNDIILYLIKKFKFKLEDSSVRDESIKYRGATISKVDNSSRPHMIDGFGESYPTLEAAKKGVDEWIDVEGIRFGDSAIRDANPPTYMDKEKACAIEREGRSAGGRNISVNVVVNVNENGYFIEEMYINTAGMWLYKVADADQYLKEFENCYKFLKKYEHLAVNSRA